MRAAIIGGVAIAVFGFFALHAYVSWNTQAHYWAVARFDATEVLEWIAKAQARCKHSKDAYCASIREVLAVGTEADDALRRKLENTEGSYQYSIPRADASTFIARASASDDIWEIGPEGPPRPVVQSPRKDGTQLGRIAHLPLILSLLVALLAGASFGVHSRGSLSPWKRGLFAAAGAVLALLAALAVSLAAVLAAS